MEILGEYQKTLHLLIHLAVHFIPIIFFFISGGTRLVGLSVRRCWWHLARVGWHATRHWSHVLALDLIGDVVLRVPPLEEATEIHQDKNDNKR